MEERKLSDTRCSSSDARSGSASVRKNVTIPFTMSASEPNTIILHHPLKEQNLRRTDASGKQMTVPLVNSKPESTSVETRPQNIGASISPQTSASYSKQTSSSKLLSSTELISTNSFARCSKKVTDKGITFEIKAESKPKRKTVDTTSPGVVKKMRSPGVMASSFQRTFYVPPGEDVQKATERVVSQITAELNKQAASQLAQGHTPDKETVIEITRIAAPVEGYFSRENIKKVTSTSGGKRPLPDSRNLPQLNLSPEKGMQKTQMQGSVALSNKQGDRTPSPPTKPSPTDVSKQSASKNIVLQTPSKKIEHAKFSGSSVQFKTKFNVAPISMPLITCVGSHSSANSINHRPLQVIVPQPRKLCGSESGAKLIPSRLVSTATIQNGRLHTVIQPATTASSAIPSAATPPLSIKTEPMSVRLENKALLKTEIPFPGHALTKIKQEPVDLPPASQSVQSPSPQSSVTNTVIKPATTLHTVTLTGTGITQPNKGKCLRHLVLPG